VPFSGEPIKNFGRVDKNTQQQIKTARLVGGKFFCIKKVSGSFCWRINLKLFLPGYNSASAAKTPLPPVNFRTRPAGQEENLTPLIFCLLLEITMCFKFQLTEKFPP